MTYILIFNCLSVSAQEQLYVFMHNDGIHLRWKGVYDKEFNGYNVYRNTNGGAWELLNPKPLQLVASSAEALAVSGGKSEILYELLGKTGGGVTNDELVEVYNESSFFEAICVVNPELAWMLAERYSDSSAELGQQYAYKVTWLDGNTERDWLEKTLPTYGVQTVPEVGEVKVVAKDGLVNLSLQPNLADLQSGDAITWNIYRSESRNGPFEKINFENTMPVSVNSNGTKEQPSLSHMDAFLSNGNPVFYRFKMVNAAGIEGGYSKVYMAVPEVEVESFGIEEFNVKVWASTAVVSWDVSKSGATYEVYSSREGAQTFERLHEGISNTGLSQWIDADYKAGMTAAYFIKFELEGKAFHSDTLRIISLDYLPPPKPTIVSAERLDSITVKITWNKSPHDDVIGYEVERLRKKSSRSGLKVNKGYLSDTTFIDTLEQAFYGKYYYRVFAYDKSYNSSVASEWISVSIPDPVPPQSPRPWSLDAKEDSVIFKWSPSADLDLAYFEVFGVNTLVNNETSYTTNKTELHFALRDTGRFGFYVQAIDSTNNRSNSSDTLYITRKLALPRAPAFVLAEKKGKGLNVIWEQADSTRIHMLLLTRVDPITDERLDIWQGPTSTIEYFDAYADPGKSWRFEMKAYNRDWIAREAVFLRYQPPED